MGGMDEPGNGSSNVIDYVTIASTGNAADFGDLVGSGHVWSSSASNAVRGIQWCGHTPLTNHIEYITIATLGNSTDFGDCSTAHNCGSAVASPTRCCDNFAITGSTDYSNVVEYVEIMTTGNAKDFGDLTQGRYITGGCSNGHGGLG